ncbi:hypothetical protein VMCG_01964 [Cytospora schulzeri]|uniref:Uncharacterized protein n=1 Tax=Cytospora schulzeri TaxID=448051 RepID=A0A423X372_9PEZI|nr:hypothetical protein VMCG_01964 [Valsa malicola]
MDDYYIENTNNAAPARTWQDYLDKYASFFLAIDQKAINDIAAVLSTVSHATYVKPKQEKPDFKIANEAYRVQEGSMSVSTWGWRFTAERKKSLMKDANSIRVIAAVFERLGSSSTSMSSFRVEGIEYEPKKLTSTSFVATDMTGKSRIVAIRIQAGYVGIAHASSTINMDQLRNRLFGMVNRIAAARKAQDSA